MSPLSSFEKEEEISPHDGSFSSFFEVRGRFPPTGGSSPSLKEGFPHDEVGSDGVPSEGSFFFSSFEKGGIFPTTRVGC